MKLVVVFPAQWYGEVVPVLEGCRSKMPFRSQVMGIRHGVLANAAAVGTDLG